MADTTTGPPLNLTLPDIGEDVDLWGPKMNANLQAINAAFQNLAALNVYDLVQSFGPPDGASVFAFVSPVPLPDALGKTYAVIYNGVIQVCGNTVGASGNYYTVSGSNNTVITFSFPPESTADLRIMVI